MALDLKCRALASSAKCKLEMAKMANRIPVAPAWVSVKAMRRTRSWTATLSMHVR